MSSFTSPTARVRWVVALGAESPHERPAWAVTQPG